MTFGAGLTRDEFLFFADVWSRDGEGVCYICGTDGPLFRRRMLDSPDLKHCAECRDEIRRSYGRRLSHSEWIAQYLCEPPPPLPPGTYCHNCSHDGPAYNDRMVPRREGENVPCCPGVRDDKGKLVKDCGCTAHMVETVTVR